MALGYGYSYGNSYGLADRVMLLLPLDQLLPIDGLSSNASQGISRLPINNRGLREGLTTFAGLAVYAPADSTAENLNGSMQFSFFDDFYNRVYVYPSPIDFGIITEDIELPLTIWNAHLNDVSLLSVKTSGIEDAGVTVALPGMPKILKALQEYPYSIAASISGPTDIATSMRFSFSDGEFRDVIVEGLRGKLWPFRPNWSREVQEAWEFKTEIHRSRSGQEQRISQRLLPRKSIEFMSHVTGDERREFNRLMDKYQNVEYVVPDLPRHISMTDTADIGAQILEIETIPEWLFPGSLIVLVFGKRIALAYLDSIDEENLILELNSPLEEQWPAGTWICFAHIGNVSDSLTTRRLTNDVAEVSFRFDTVPGREPYLDPGVADVYFDGREVLLQRPNWGEAVNLTFDRALEKVDYGRGVVSRFSPEPFGSRITRWSYTNRDYETADKIFRLFLRVAGQRGEFFMPTWEHDLPPRLPASSGSASLRIKGDETAKIYANDRVFKNIAVVLNTGEILLRQVTSMFVVEDSNGKDTLIQVAGAWPQAITLFNVVMISWLPLCRLGSDSLTIDWLTDSKSQFQLTTRSLEYQPAEA